MFERFLRNAMDNGTEVIVSLNNLCTEYQGQVTQMEDGFFSLFHSGRNGGILWAFRLQDVVACGLVIERPDLLPTNALSTPCASQLIVETQPERPLTDDY